MVLVGASGAGKSSWAAEHFAPDQVVSSDRLRAVVGEGEEDLSASEDAFALLDQIVGHRARRRLTTVIDTLGLDPDRRAGWLRVARAHGLATAAVVFATPVGECRTRNSARGKPMPDAILSQQVKRVAEQRSALDDEDFDVVLDPVVVRTAPASVARTATAATAATNHADRQTEAPVGLRFGLQIPVWSWPGGAAEIRTRLRAIAAAAEEAGFDSIWVMDHFRQIPMFGGAWQDMLESWTTLAFLAGVTERVRLGTLVTGITYRNVAHLGKIAATLDVLSGGRARCGLGVGWYAAEHEAYGWPFPPVTERYALLEDALQLLPLLWGKGAPAFEGRMITVPEAMSYPRPIQDRIPILVGGNGERRTLRLAATYADACNIIGEIDVVARKVAALHAHCDAAGRDRDAVEVTQLSTTLVGRDGTEVQALVERLRPRKRHAERYAAAVNAGTVADQIGRFRALADAGVATAIVSLPDLGDTAPLERFAGVISAFR
ncbi:MAG: TIGR03560 family F420-dependent LLM class oxidoreductase [Acidimicrobiia bacterium]|nr:TIGR03560 family F420-dependent LLM class oxidoreductase [Acidimicrobiia bacterium]